MSSVIRIGSWQHARPEILTIDQRIEFFAFKLIEKPISLGGYFVLIQRADFYAQQAMPVAAELGFVANFSVQTRGSLVAYLELPGEHQQIVVGANHARDVIDRRCDVATVH